MTNEIFEKNLEAFKEAKPSHFAALEPQIEKFRKNSESSSDDKVIKVIDGALGTKNLVPPVLLKPNLFQQLQLVHLVQDIGSQGIQKGPKEMENGKLKQFTFIIKYNIN